MGAVTDEDEKGLRGIPCLIGTGLRLPPDDVFVSAVWKRGAGTNSLFDYYHTRHI